MQRLSQTVKHPTSAFLLSLCFAVSAGCHPPLPGGPDDTPSVIARVPYIEISGGPPRLSTNEVVRIALACASAHRHDIQKYDCTAIFFDGNTSDPILLGKWTLHFAPERHSLHEDFYIRVDDRTQEAEYVHH